MDDDGVTALNTPFDVSIITNYYCFDIRMYVSTFHSCFVRVSTNPVPCVVVFYKQQNKCTISAFIVFFATNERNVAIVVVVVVVNWLHDNCFENLWQKHFP